MKERVATIIALLTLTFCVQAQSADSLVVSTEEPIVIKATQPTIVTDEGSELYAMPDATSRKVVRVKDTWLPDPQKAMWYAFIFPGAGQIYNRSYWKLPIVYGGAVGLAYGISWNHRYYREYSQAYRAAMSSNPLSYNYKNLLPDGTDPTSSYAQNLLKTKHNTYRRYRDLCIVGAVAFYALTIVEAYVDASLADFDISPDLSMRVAPAVFITENNQKPNVGVEIGFNF